LAIRHLAQAQLFFRATKMDRRLSLLFAVAGLILIPSPSPASFEIVSQSVKPDLSKRETNFELNFNEAPDFTTVDSFQRPKNSFQYWIDTNPHSFDFQGPNVAVIRGPEIRFDHNIPIRDTVNPTNQDFPHAEGWGKQLGAVDFELDGKILSFTVPWNILHQADGKFSFDVISLDFGSQVSEVSGAIIGLPIPIASAAALLTFAWLVRRRVNYKLDG
jgi:uncharacterized protein (TIGR03382 family)